MTNAVNGGGKHRLFIIEICVKDRNKSGWEKLFRFEFFIIYISNDKIWDTEKPKSKCLWQPRRSDVLSFVVEVNMNFDYKNVVH